MQDERMFAKLMAVVRAGGGLDLEAGAFATEQLCQLARTAKASAARLILHGLTDRSQEDLVMIGRAGSGSVVFRIHPTQPVDSEASASLPLDTFA
jgi:hypothetical protein